MMEHLRKAIARIFLILAVFGLPFAGQAQTIDAIKQAAKEAKVTPDLLPVLTSGSLGQQAPIGGLQRVDLFMTSGNSIAIDAVANSEVEGQALLQALQALGLSQGILSKHRVTGYLPIDKLDQLKNIDALKLARPTYQPAHNVGSVTSQGDTSLRSYVARSTYGVDGTGVKVGILSDSYNNKGGAPAGVASGDLPAGVQVLKDLTSGGTDEGRGMAELVHDVAPGSPLAFYTAFVSQLDFAQGIRDLAAAGCKIITDDVFYYAEPFFQDGPIAQAVDDVVNNSGVTYFSSAGNHARTSYQNTFNPTSTTITGYLSAHNFSGGDIRQSFLLRGGGRTSIISFQWDDPFFSVSGGAGAQTDMDLLVYINGALRTDLSSMANNIGGDPLEIIGIRNPGSDITIELVLAKKSGPDPNLVKWIFFGNGITTTIEYDTKSSTAVGHNNSSRAISVGAAPFYDTPAYNNTLTTAVIEPFSSAGGTPIFFSTTGARINGTVGIVRQKPEITSVDGGNTTFFGTDTNRDADAFPNFFGTSAAAPHAAAVAALMKQKVPAITRDAILTAMENTALDMDDPSTAGFDTGFDFGTGYGFIQADRALQAITLTSLTLTASANPSVILTTGTTTLSATVSGGTTPYSYTFSGPGTISQSPTSNTATVSGLSAGVQTFTVVARDATSPASQTISATVSVTVNNPSPGNTPPTVANPVGPQSATVGVAYTLSLANVFTDAETPNSLTLSVSGLPAGLSFTPPSTISGTPSMSGVSSVTVVATDPGSLTASNVFSLTVSPASGTPPPSGTFSITGVTTVSCQVLSATERQLTFNPRYAGVDGSPISFSVANEMLPTTSPGPYGLHLYTDNPVITLQARQGSTTSSFAYSWVAACSTPPSGNTPPTVANPVGPQSATVGVAYTLSLANVFTDAETPNSLTLSVSGLPAGLSFTPPSTISGTPSMSGVSTVTVVATDPGSLTASNSFNITVSSPSGTPPPPPSGTFSITGVTTVNCQVLSVGQRELTFNPRYAGVDGSPISFSVANEMLPTTSPGPYSLRLYTDNPVITLQAQQGSTTSSFAYSWVAACSTPSPGNTPPTVANPVGPQSATVGVAYTLSLANVFTDAETPNNLILSVSGLPAGLSFNPPSTISGTPSMSGVSSVTVVATDPGSLTASTSFTITVSPSSGTPPPSGTFSITGVTTVSCQVLSATERQLTFNPRYAGVDGSPISFSVANEMLPTTDPGPYSLHLYTDNPVITLQAKQGSATSSFTYSWLAACGASPRVAASEPGSNLKASVLPNPVREEFTVRIEGAQGQRVQLQLSDLSGHAVVNTSVEVSTPQHETQVRFNQQGMGLYLLRVSTGQQAVLLKVIKE